MMEPSPAGAGVPGASCLFDAMWAVPRWLGLGVDALMSRMVHAFAGVASGFAGGPPGGPASAAAPAGGPAAAVGGAGWPATGPWAIRGQPPAGGGGEPEDAGTGPEGGLAAGGIKLVEYALVSVRRCAEGILPGGTGSVLVTERMTGVDFAVWMVARYLQSAPYRAAAERDPARVLRHEDKKYLRVYYRVLTRWATPPSSGCGDREADALARIRDAIRGLGPAAAGAAPAPRPSPRAPSPAPPSRSARPAAAPRRAAAAPASTGTGAAAAAAERHPAAPAPTEPAAAAEAAETAEVLRALHKLGGSAATSDLVRRTRLPRSRVRRALHELEAAGRIRRRGEGLQTRYHEEVSE